MCYSSFHLFLLSVLSSFCSTFLLSVDVFCHFVFPSMLMVVFFSIYVCKLLLSVCQCDWSFSLLNSLSVCLFGVTVLFYLKVFGSVNSFVILTEKFWESNSTDFSCKFSCLFLSNFSCVFFHGLKCTLTYSLLFNYQDNLLNRKLWIVYFTIFDTKLAR